MGKTMENLGKYGGHLWKTMENQRMMINRGFSRKFHGKIHVDWCDFAAKFDDTGGYTMGV